MRRPGPYQQHCTARRGSPPGRSRGRPAACLRALDTLDVDRGMLGLGVNWRGGARDHDNGGPAEHGPGCGGGDHRRHHLRAVVPADAVHRLGRPRAGRPPEQRQPPVRGRARGRRGPPRPGARGGRRQRRPRRRPTGRAPRRWSPRSAGPARWAGRSRCRSAPSRAPWPCTCASPRSWSTAGTWLRPPGRSPPSPEDLAEQELAFTRDALGALPPGRSPFAPPTPAPDTAPALDRLAACLGRRLPGPDDATADEG